MTRKRKHTNTKRSISNEFGIQYAKECNAFYQDATLYQNFKWEEHIPILRRMCGMAYKYQVSMDSEADRMEAMTQAESTWRYLWSGKTKGAIIEYCDQCLRFEELGFTCTHEENCDCPKCMGFCECKEE